MGKKVETGWTEASDGKGGGVGRGRIKVGIFLYFRFPSPLCHYPQRLRLPDTRGYQLGPQPRLTTPQPRLLLCHHWDRNLWLDVPFDSDEVVWKEGTIAILI